MILENSKLLAEFDEKARLVRLIDSSNGINVIEKPTDDAFRLILADDRCKENIVFGGAQDFRAEKQGDRLVFTTESLSIDNGRADSGKVDLTLSLCVTLDGDRLSFTAKIANQTDMRILDFEYPRLGVIKTLGDGKPTLFWPDQPGRFIYNIGENLSRRTPNRENGSNTIKMSYPGPATLGLMALTDRSETLSVAIKDPDFIAAELKVVGDHNDIGAITLVVDKNLCMKSGEMTTAPIDMKLYRGDWHEAADDYREFIDPLRPKHTKPDWAKEMLGYFLVINKQQFGYEMWDYTTLPTLWKLAKSHGYDTLGLFGWYDSGHDNNYPDLEVSESMGGEKTLKENIKAVQADGGRVTLYYQGHLIDVESDFYKNREGKYVASKNIWGSDYVEFYSKSHKSDFLDRFSRKMFALACPACDEWQELMLEREKWIASFGADGTLYDQIGGMPPNICFDERHPHDGENPARALTGGQSKLVTRLQEGAKAISPEFIFMSEHLTDLYSSRLDVVHGIGNLPGFRGDRKFKAGCEELTSTVMPEVFRYICPEVLVTLRNPNPFTEKRAVGYAFAFDFPLEMELRYRQDKLDILEDRYAELREWSKAVNELRGKYVSELRKGQFRDAEGLTNRDPYIFAKRFDNGDKTYVTIWNDSDSERLPEISVEGKKLVSFETVDGRYDKAVPLAPDAVAMCLFRDINR